MKTLLLTLAAVGLLSLAPANLPAQTAPTTVIHVVTVTWKPGTTPETSTSRVSAAREVVGVAERDKASSSAAAAEASLAAILPPSPAAASLPMICRPSRQPDASICPVLRAQRFRLRSRSPDCLALVTDRISRQAGKKNRAAANGESTADRTGRH